MAMVSPIYRWAGRARKVPPTSLGAAMMCIKALSSKPELIKTVERMPKGAFTPQMSAPKGAQHRVK